MKYLFAHILLILLFVYSCSSRPLTYTVASHSFIRADSASFADSAIKADIMPYREELNATMNEIIGYASATMISDKPEGSLSSLVADIVYEAGIELVGEAANDASMALVNVRGIRAPLSQGEIKLKNTYEIMPFENRLAAVKLSGNILQEVFNHIVIRNGDGISQATFTMTPQGAEDIKIHKKELNEDQTYWLFTSDFLAEGGDGYLMFSRADTIVLSDDTIRDLIIRYIKKENAAGNMIVPDTVARITVSSYQ
jgi:2',3'-cyclic-nucleotide 2'-phosphodiesterase (5'-nucleotidase family)